MTGVWNPVAVFDDDGRDDEVREIVEEAVDILHPDADTAVELRALAHTGPARTGVFRDRNALAADADALDLSGRCKGVYVTIQRARAVVPAIDRLVAGGRGVGNADIDYRQWLPIDLDPVRPSGTSSTDTELVAAIDLANQIAGDLVERGVPVGALLAAQSGNGAHLLVRCSLPADDGGLTRRLLVGLDRRYSTATVRVDTAVHNAARIWRLYGTVARKGDPADPDRPHRRGRILRRPTPGVVAPVAALVALAGREPTPPRRRRGGRIDFAQVRDAALGRFPELLRRWLPDGELRGSEYIALNPQRVDRRPGSFRVNVRTGRWADFAVPGVSGGDPISLAAYLADCSQVEAARGLAVALWGG